MPAIHNRSRLRFGATPLRRAVTALAIAAAVLLPGCRKCELDPEMASDVGPTARNCGALTLNAGADQLSVAESCAVQAEAENAPFTLASDVRGVDSHVRVGFARDTQGRSWEYAYDGNTHGGGGDGNPELSRVSCEAITSGCNESGGAGPCLTCVKPGPSQVLCQ